ncbi:hypothetical protein QMW73_06105 [Cronobacter sakazakii]|uniref:DUF7740 domain-containing protein n=1 Tax=Cronobacter sakazakii TaxID=28141 RepID=UPI0003F697D8|nr:hypothetical protein [Cronobacter sakazakii]EGT4410514.1 hypothetical protein [Cronobacter sakazakii]KAB1044516.1 hypothetical protein AUM84_11945 [Cronobacter sakazakii]KAB1049427.1 hypothetical protein AUM85_19755 [Cronobacter sakazakii]MDK1306519.1 hypothetical protein [Cronobacter sakazakii]HAU5508439.1 hypothetical protein [Cronobacter sakazakii]
MSKDTTMNEAQKIAQELATIPDEFQDKAVAATLKSQFWEIIDCPVTLDLALAFARLDGVDNTSRLRKCARALALKTQDPKACGYLLEIYEADDPQVQLEAFKTFRDRLILKVAKEFKEVNKIGDVRQYRLKRQTRVTLSNIFGRKVA